MSLVELSWLVFDSVLPFLSFIHGPSNTLISTRFVQFFDIVHL